MNCVLLLAASGQNDIATRSALRGPERKWLLARGWSTLECLHLRQNCSATVSVYKYMMNVYGMVAVRQSRINGVLLGVLFSNNLSCPPSSFQIFDALDDEFPARLENIPNKVDMIKLRAQFPPTFRPENMDQLVCFTQSNSLTAAFNSTAGSSPECEAWIRFAGPSAGEYCMMLV